MNVADVKRLRAPGPGLLARVLLTVAVPTGTLLCALAALVLPAEALTGVVFGVFIGIVASLTTDVPLTGGAARTAGDRRRAGLRIGAFVTAGWLVVTGLALVAGPATGIIIAAMLLTAPLPWLWRATRTGGRTAPAEHHEEQSDTLPTAAVALGDLTTPALCATWQRSYFAMLDVPPCPARYATVRMRERLLDELERRDPAGFARWLQTGARAGSDPGRYLASDR